MNPFTQLLETLNDGKNWTTKALGRNEKNESCKIEEACSLCLVGAVIKEFDNDGFEDRKNKRHKIISFMAAELDKKYGNASISEFNDLHEWPEIKGFLKECEIKWNNDFTE